MDFEQATRLAREEGACATHTGERCEWRIDEHGMVLWHPFKEYAQVGQEPHLWQTPPQGETPPMTEWYHADCSCSYCLSA